MPITENLKHGSLNESFDVVKSNTTGVCLYGGDPFSVFKQELTNSNIIIDYYTAF